VLTEALAPHLADRREVRDARGALDADALLGLRQKSRGGRRGGAPEATRGRTVAARVSHASRFPSRWDALADRAAQRDERGPQDSLLVHGGERRTDTADVTIQFRVRLRGGLDRSAQQFRGVFLAEA